MRRRPPKSTPTDTRFPVTTPVRSVSVAVSGYVDCTCIQVENWAKREGHFLSGGAFGIGRTSLLTGEDLPDSSDIDHVSDMDARTFQLPLATLANPQIGIDQIGRAHV